MHARKAEYLVPLKDPFLCWGGAIPLHITMADGSGGSHGGKGRDIAIFAHLATF